MTRHRKTEDACTITPPCRLHCRMHTLKFLSLYPSDALSLLNSGPYRPVQTKAAWGDPIVWAPAKVAGAYTRPHLCSTRAIFVKYSETSKAPHHVGRKVLTLS